MASPCVSGSPSAPLAVRLRSIPTSTARSVRSSSQSIRSSAKARLVLVLITRRFGRVRVRRRRFGGRRWRLLGRRRRRRFGRRRRRWFGCRRRRRFGRRRRRRLGRRRRRWFGGRSVAVSVLVGGGVGEGEGPGDGTGDGPGPGLGPGGGSGSFPTNEPSPPTRVRTPPLVSKEKSATAEGPLPRLASSFAAPPCASPSPSGSNATYVTPLVRHADRESSSESRGRTEITIRRLQEPGHEQAADGRDCQGHHQFSRRVPHSFQ